MEDSVLWILGYLLEKFSNSLRLGRKGEILCERGIEIDHVERLKAARVLNQSRRSSDCVDEPRLAPDIAGVKHSLTTALKHYKPA